MGRRFSGRRYDGPEDFRAFDGEKTFFKVEESAAPELYALAQRFPEAFSRALKSVGNALRLELRTALSKGGPDGVRWPELSRMHVYRRMDMLRAGKKNNAGKWVHGKRFDLKKRVSGIAFQLSDKERDRIGAAGSFSFFRGKRRGTSYTRSGRLRGQSIPNAFNRWQGRGITRGPNPMGGRLWNAIRYQMVNKARVDVGAVTPSAAAHLAAVQAGRRGSKGAFEFTGTQPVTPAMRRAFWAARVPLAKDTRELKQEPRPLVAPVYRAFSLRLESYLQVRIKEYLDDYL